MDGILQRVLAQIDLGSSQLSISRQIPHPAETEPGQQFSCRAQLVSRGEVEG